LKWKKAVGVDNEGENALTYAEGAVITSHASLAAYDTTSGERLWSLPHNGGGTPVRWRHGGRVYLIYGNTEETIQCIDPRSGDILWTVANAGYNNYPLSISGDHLIANVGGRDRHTEAQLGCYRLTTEGAERVWVLPQSYGGPFGTSIVISNGYVYARLKKFVCVELETGTIVGELDKGQVNVAGSYAINDRIIFEADANHQAAVWYAMLNAEPKEFSVMGSDYWYPTHTYSSSYYQIAADAVVDGRIFIRGYYGPVCYDLRKTGETAVSGGEPRRNGSIPTRSAGQVMRSHPVRTGMTVYDIRGRRRRIGSKNMSEFRGAPGIYLIPAERSERPTVRQALGID